MDKLIEALLAAQRNIKHSLDDSTNPRFNSQYTSLEGVIDAVKEHLNAEGVYVQQITHPDPDGACVETIFHGHQASLSAGKVFLPAEKHDPQKFGSALTYARRYSLATACGIGHAKDDDAEAATEISLSSIGELRALHSKPEPKPKKKAASKAREPDDMKARLQEKGLLADDAPEETSGEVFKRIAHESVQEMNQAASLKDIEDIWKRAVSTLKPIKKEIDDTAWAIWLGHMTTLRNEMQEKTKDE